MIWCLILGHRILHVETNDVLVCCSDTTPQEEYTSWKSALIGRCSDETTTTVDPAVPISTQPTALPLPQLYYDHETCRRPDRTHVHKLYGNCLMRTCRSISQEVSHVFWTTNVFSFHDAATFQHFLDHGGMVRKQSITNIHLRGDFGFTWHEVLPRSLVTSLTGLKRLHVSVSGPVVSSLSSCGGTSVIAILECLSRFKILSIETCTIIIEDIAERPSSRDKKSASKTNFAAQALLWSQKLEKNILAVCESDEEQREMSDVMLAREICLKSSTLEGCHFSDITFAKSSLRRCTKLHVCLTCWQCNSEMDVKQRLEVARDCSQPGQCAKRDPELCRTLTLNLL